MISYRVLVVEDFPPTAELLNDILSYAGYLVTTADSAPTALAHLQRESFDLIILDIMLPGMDGLELCRQIRRTSQVPIMFLTALADVRDKVIGLRAGGGDYLAKPFDLNELLARIEVLLQRELVERQRVEAAVRVSEERFRILFEHSPDAILLIDPHDPNGQWSIVACNGVACRMHGYTREELIGQSLRLLLANVLDPDADRARLAQLRRIGILQGNVVHRRKDGTLVSIEYSTALITVTGSELILDIDRDVTARKHAEQALQTARGEAERLEELDRLRDQFIAMVSHDLRTPLTAARAALILLQASAGERHGPDDRALVDNARRNIERLNLLIDDLLTLNQFEAGILRLDCELLDLRTVITDAKAAVEPLIREKGQLLEVDLPEALPIDGDPRRLEQVLVNLLANAHHHTPTGTRIMVSARAEDGEILLSVRDTGPGIPPQELAGIFERFHRLTSADGGSGLGLAIGLSLVQLHHGRIWAESRPGAGATFHVALPGAVYGSQP